MNPSNNPGCLFGFLSFLLPKKEIKEQTPSEEQVATEVIDNKRTNYDNCYQPKYLLTKNEWYAHKRLKEIADAKGYIICPKVRLLDIVEPRKGEKDWKSLFYKIQAKHVDFIICDSGMKIKAIIELDDSTHNKKDRQERDTFVDEVLRSVGYKVIRVRYIADNVLDYLD